MTVMCLFMLPSFTSICSASPVRALGRLAALIGLSCGLALLGACSPEFDWRVVQIGDGGFAATFPGKPSAAARTVEIGGRQLQMTMHAARAGGALFAVGVVDLPDGDAQAQAQWRAQAIDAMRQGLIGNLEQPRLLEKRVELNTAGQPSERIGAVQLAAVGKTRADGGARRISARLLARGNRAFQAVVIETLDAQHASDAPESPSVLGEQVDQFLAGFQPY